MKNYYLPTPKKWRKIGDGLLGASAFITAAAIGQDVELIAYIALAIGVLGKFLTNTFSE